MVCPSHSCEHGCDFHSIFKMRYPFIHSAGSRNSTNTNNRLPHVLEIFALFMFMSILTTLCISETARKTLEELSGDDVSYNAHGEETADVREITKEPAIEEKISV